MPTHLVVMGVAGTGKTTVAERLAGILGLPMAEGDDFHPGSNRDKMSAGIPLVDDDRWPWLRALRDWMSARAGEGSSTVVACSALRVAYRDVLREADGDVFFVQLVLPAAENLDRLEARPGHFMKGGMLDSQLATLEPLGAGEAGLEVVNTGDPDDVVADAVARLRALLPDLG